MLCVHTVMSDNCWRINQRGGGGLMGVALVTNSSEPEY